MQSVGKAEPAQMFFFPPVSPAAAVLDSFHRRMISVGERPLCFKFISLDAQVMTSCIS